MASAISRISNHDSSENGGYQPALYHCTCHKQLCTIISEAMNSVSLYRTRQFYPVMSVQCVWKVFTSVEVNQSQLIHPGER